MSKTQSQVEAVFKFDSILSDLNAMMHTNNAEDLVDYYVSLHERLYLFYQVNSRRIKENKYADQQLTI